MSLKKYISLSLFLIIMGCISAQNSNSLRIMSFNIRYDNPGDGINSWKHRKDLVAKIILETQPDIIATQEGLYHQILELQKSLPQYGWIGVGRDSGKLEGEFTAIFYRLDRLSIDTSNHFWLSETPEIPGSKSWNTACTRMLSWAKFKDRRTEKSFYFLNTHLDHASSNAREMAAKLILVRSIAMTHPDPMILAGDFNCTTENQAIQTIETLYNNSFTLARIKAASPDYTFAGFSGEAISGNIIDYIFVRNIDQVIRAFIYNKGYQEPPYPSDHLPIITDLVLE